MPEEADWALIAPYDDRSLIRNALVYSLGRDMGMQAPRWAFVEAYINYEQKPISSDSYQGVYGLVETIKNAKNRVDLKQLDADDTTLPKISGGYIFKFDQMATEEPTLECKGSDLFSSGLWGPSTGGTCWSDLEVTDPDPLIPEQETWLTEYIQAFHDALHEEPMGDIGAYIHLESFADYFIVNELTRNIDAYIRSAYYHKDRDGLIQAGPLWDYNFSLDSGSEQNCAIEGWQWEEGRKGTNDWFLLLPENPLFMDAVKARWQYHRQSVLRDGEVDKKIDALKAPLTNAGPRDMELWPVSLITEGGGFMPILIPDDPTWEGQVEAVREWIHERMAWMDTQLL